MIHKIKTPPVSEPVSLADMRSHLGIVSADDTTRDGVIAGRIISARQWCEYYTRTAFVQQTWIGYAKDFPSDAGIIELKAPLVSVVTIKYVDSDGIQQLLSNSAYQVDLVSCGIVPAYGSNWPSANRPGLNSVEIEYSCGYGNVAAVPESIKDAIRFIVGQWEVFQSSMEGVVRPFTIPNAAKQLLDSYVDMRGYF